MSSIPSSSGESKGFKVSSGDLVDVARFNGQFQVGRELEPMSSISTGARFRDRTVKVSYFNPTFMCIEFSASARDASPYIQLVPWAAISTVIMK